LFVCFALFWFVLFCFVVVVFCFFVCLVVCLLYCARSAATGRSAALVHQLGIRMLKYNEIVSFSKQQQYQLQLLLALSTTFVPFFRNRDSGGNMALLSRIFRY